MKGNHYAGTGILLRLYLRRDRFVLPAWILLPMLIMASQLSFVGAMADWREFITELSASPLTSALLGPIVPLSKEGAILWRGMVQGSIAVMFGAALTTIRHTRTEESLGRYANLTAALMLSCGGSLLAGLLVSSFLMGGGFAVRGSLLAGLTLAVSGWIFAGIGGLSAQIFEHSGPARAVVIGAYGFTMIAMALNNVRGGRTAWAWFAPELWYRITEPFGENYAWPFFCFILLSILTMLVAYCI